MALSAIFGCSGVALTEAERAFFKDADPWGFILFKRNCADPRQVRDLVEELRASVGRADAPVLIDQEGGRVMRLAPPVWPPRPAMARIGAVYRRDPSAGREAAWLAARLIAHDLAELGVTVDCAPVLDIPQPDADDIIGDRAFGDKPDIIAALGRAVCEGLEAGGVLPVIKHIPGHGRALVDSHLELPRVAASAETLAETDFAPFAALSDAPMAMTAHIVYEALDASAPATTSPAVIGEVIRKQIGFDNLLMSDDLSMKALGGAFDARARAALAAGCDVVLHCNGEMDEMELVASGAITLDGVGARRAADALSRLHAAQPFNAREGEDRLAELLVQEAA